MSVSVCLGRVVAASLPPVAGRLGHALLHDLAAPLRMLDAVVDATATGPVDRRAHMSTVARDALSRLSATVEGLADAIRFDVSGDGVTPADEVRRLAVAAFTRQAAAEDDLGVQARDVPLPATTLEAVLDDLFMHALAEPDGGTRAVRLVVVDDVVDETRIEVVDDGRPPTASPAGRVRSVSGSTARSLLVPQRVVEARAGTVAVMPDPGAVRVIMSWPTGAAGSGRG